MSFSIDADKRAVPDAGQFADWMLQMYEQLKEDANATLVKLTEDGHVGIAMGGPPCSTTSRARHNHHHAHTTDGE